MPGTSDLEAWSLQRTSAADHAKKQKLEETSQRAASEAEQDQEDGQAIHAAAKRQTEQADSEKSVNGVRITFSDRVLNVTFAFFRSVSVLAVCLGGLVIVGSVIWIIISLSRWPPGPGPEEIFQSPDSEAFLAHCNEVDRKQKRAAARRRVEALQQGTGRPFIPEKPSEAREWTCLGFEDAIESVLSDFSLPPEDRDALCDWLKLNLDSHADRNMFMQGLGVFAETYAQDTKALRRGRLTIEPQDAMQWYQSTFVSRWKAAREATDLREAAAENLARDNSQNIQLAWQIMGLALIFLMGFITLPLLIQIERNTRSRAADLPAGGNQPPSM